MSYEFPHIKKLNGPRDTEYSRFTYSELHGFVCPECMDSFSSSEELMTHFKSHEAVSKMPGSTIKLELAPDDKTNAVSYTELLDEMSKHNNLLLQQISNHSRHIYELETALDLLINGSPVAPSFNFSDTELKHKVITFLESQAQSITAKSELEASRQELQQKSEEIDRLKTQITQLEEYVKLKQNVCFTDRDTQTELNSVYEELNHVRSALRESESRYSELFSMSKARGPDVLLVSGSCQTEPKIYQPTESEDTTSDSTSSHIPTVDPATELNLISTELKSAKARLSESETRRQSEEESAQNRIANRTKTLRSKQAELVQVQSSYETQVTTLIAESNRLKAELELSSTALAQLQSERDDLRGQVQALTEWRQRSECSQKALEQQLHREQSNWVSERVELQAQLTQLQQSLSDMQTVKDSLDERCTNLTKQITDQKSLANSMEAQLVRQKQDVERQLEESQTQLQLSRKEVDSLLERLITAEDKSVSLEEQVRLQSQDVERLKKAIFELGRENQSLQMLRERVTSRQWTKDDDVTQCSNCHSEFSLTNRKHHCRHCGGIFCHGCSAQRASIAASKDPVRVCVPCYTELTGSGSH